MRVIIFAVLLLCLYGVANGQPSQKLFVRIFDASGKKIHKGFYLRTSDDAITIWEHNNAVELPIQKIQEIKLRRSIGHSILITSLAFAVPFAILGAATADPSAWIFGYTAGEGLFYGFITGIITGGAIGTIYGSIRNRPVLFVGGDSVKWQKVRPILNDFL